jgi:hypothetical protein
VKLLATSGSGNLDLTGKEGVGDMSSKQFGYIIEESGSTTPYRVFLLEHQVPALRNIDPRPKKGAWLAVPPEESRNIRFGRWSVAAQPSPTHPVAVDGLAANPGVGRLLEASGRSDRITKESWAAAEIGDDGRPVASKTLLLGEFIRLNPAECPALLERMRHGRATNDGVFPLSCVSRMKSIFAALNIVPDKPGAVRPLMRPPKAKKKNPAKSLEEQAAELAELSERFRQQAVDLATAAATAAAEQDGRGGDESRAAMIRGKKRQAAYLLEEAERAEQRAQKLKRRAEEAAAAADTSEQKTENAVVSDSSASPPPSKRIRPEPASQEVKGVKSEAVEKKPPSAAATAAAPVNCVK